MSIVVFTGPTLSAEEAAEELQATYLGPVAQGDVYRVAADRPWGIGIIDGYFDRVPAVWHKEILWAMSRGVHVFGSASMGALRAAELATFGMEGIGSVFEAYHTGRLEDDDEVAIAHATEEAGYRPISDAMVNIRATLQEANAAGVVSEQTHAKLIEVAKRTFYPLRTYELVLSKAQKAAVADSELDALRSWLVDNHIDQKKRDAIDMLREMGRQFQGGREAKTVKYTFQHTDAWEQVRRRLLSSTARAAPDVPAAGQADVLEELRLRGPAFVDHWRMAMIDVLAEDVSSSGQLSGDDRLLADQLEQFRLERGLLDPAAIETWLESQGLHRDELIRLLRRQIRVHRIVTTAESAVERTLLDRLRLEGSYARFAARASEKAQMLAEHGLENPSIDATGLSQEELFEWYFQTVLGLGEEPSVAEYAHLLGFPDRWSFRFAVLREWHYRKLGSSPG